MMNERKKNIAIIGSTGSIGTQALEVIGEHTDLFQAEVLTAQNNADLLIRQAIEYQPNAVVIGNKEKYRMVSEALHNYDIKVYAGSRAVEEVVAMETVDMVLMAIVGFAALRPVLSALRAAKPLAIANKETFVVAGEVMIAEALKSGAPVIPVDSEHSAIFQCLIGEQNNKIEKIILTASGGPFYGKDLSFLEKVTPAQALRHPNWEMGNKITIDSATLMNKGFEVIEARWLFNLKPGQIDVVVHPQSVIHSMVQFSDGSIKAQMGLPDMKLPIQYALAFPVRLTNSFQRFDFGQYPNLNFGVPDKSIFRNLAIAFEALEKGGNAPAIVNAANEVAVEAFLNERLSFLGISDAIEYALSQVDFIAKPVLDDYFATDEITRQRVKEFIRKL